MSIHVGQAGVQLGDTIWELYRQEHDVNADGTANRFTDTGAFFSACDNGKFVPHSIFVDLEPTVIDEIRNGTHKTFYHPETMICGVFYSLFFIKSNIILRFFCFYFTYSIKTERRRCK